MLALCAIDLQRVSPLFMASTYFPFTVLDISLNPISCFILALNDIRFGKCDKVSTVSAVSSTLFTLQFITVLAFFSYVFVGTDLSSAGPVLVLCCIIYVIFKIYLQPTSCGDTAELSKSLEFALNNQVLRIGKRMAVMTILNSAGIILIILMVTPAVTIKNHMWVLSLLLWICHSLMSLTEIITVTKQSPEKKFSTLSEERAKEQAQDMFSRREQNQKSTMSNMTNCTVRYGMNNVFLLDFLLRSQLIAVSALLLSAVLGSWVKTSIALSANHLLTVVLSSQGLEGRLNDSSEQPQNQVQSGFLLDVIVGQSSSILQLLSGEDKSLLIWRDSFLVLDLGLDGIDGVGWVDVQGDGLTRKGLDENLHRHGDKSSIYQRCNSSSNFNSHPTHTTLFSLGTTHIISTHCVFLNDSAPG
jgi:hypothetical protein